MRFIEILSHMYRHVSETFLKLVVSLGGTKFIIFPMLLFNNAINLAEDFLCPDTSVF